MKYFVLTVVLIIISAVGSQAQLNCHATFDVNNDGVPLTLADHDYLRSYFLFQHDSLPRPYRADITGDCIVDMRDDSLYVEYMTYGLEVFDDYPVSTCCNTPQSCCVGVAGNVDNDPDELINISDVTRLITHLYSNGRLPTCTFEADVNDDKTMNIYDVTYIIEFLYSGGPAPVACD